MTQKSMMGLVRYCRSKIRGSCFWVTWDIDSQDQRAVGRVQYFLFGRRYVKCGKEYEYKGFVWKEGVRYAAQSALFVTPVRLAEIVKFLESNGVDHEFEPVTLP